MASNVAENSFEDEEEMNLSDEEGGMRIDGIYIPPPPKPACSVETTGPRLIITKIVNDFFKSYANSQSLGPFHKCFNAIVGPNGSGKSNVIDSMLFVFGYRATKIRSKKLSVLLHNSTYYPNVQGCTVSVHFALIVDKEGDDYDVVPGSEFVVSRTALKDNSSYYQLNGKRVQFKEIAVILRGHGIDLDHNRFLILQGEVEQISMMKCKGTSENETGMLEYLEDIIGTSRFKVPLIKLQDRVETLSEQRYEKLNRLKLVESELQALKGPMEEAVGFLELENTITKDKNFLYQKNVYELENKSTEYQKTTTEIVEELDELDGKLKELQTTKVSKESELKDRSSSYDDLKQRNDKMKEAFEKANNKDIKLQAEMPQINDTRKKNKELLNQEKKKLADYEGIPAKNEQDITELQNKIIELTNTKENLDQEKTKVLQTLGSETKELQKKMEVLQTKLGELKKIVDETKSSYTLAQSELEIYVSTETKETKILEELKTTYNNSKTAITEITEEISKLKKTIPLTEKSLKEVTEEHYKVKLEEAKIIEEINKKRASVEEFKYSMQASKSRGRVLDSLMQQKVNGNCPGLFGRLGDLGAITQKYDVAISTACGPLDNLVVDTVSTAQWCIEYLKKYDIGRATFIVLEKQEHLWNYINSPITTPENVPRLFDLIQVEDNRVKTAFYYGLRDTLVANDLDQASRIAYGSVRHRVVTLKGDLIETTGTMSGGGKQVRRGRMGQSVAVSQTQPEDIKQMEVDLEQLEKQLSNLRIKQNQLENQINALQPELGRMKVTYEKHITELECLKQQVLLLTKQLKAQETKSTSAKVDKNVVNKLTHTTNVKKDAYDAAAADASELQVKVDAITKEIKLKTSGKMKEMDDKINRNAKNIDILSAEISKLKVAIKTANRNATKSAEKISNLEKSIQEAENTLRNMKQQRDEIESDGRKLLECIERIAEQLSQGENEFSDLQNEVASLRKKENQLLSDKIEIEHKLTLAKDTLNNCKSSIASWKHKMNQLKMQEIPDHPREELKTYTSEELANRNVQNIQREIQVNEEQMKATKPNLNAIEEYRKKQKVFIERCKDLEELTQKRTKMKELHESLRNRRKEEFLNGYSIIKMKLKEMYQMITLGGDADFELVDTYDPFTEGIQFNVRPPKKSWKNISNLSGGEKTLSSLALVFALHYYKPSPLYVMDEIDAALDFKNVSIVGNYIKERTKNAQFIIISLRSNMFELCDHLIGIYKTFNCTKSITIDPRIYDQETTEQANEPATIQNDVTQSNAQLPEQEINSSNVLANESASDISEMQEQEQTSVINDSMELEMNGEVNSIP